MNNEPAIVWMKAPFLRLLPAFAAGIIFHFYLKPNPQLLWIAFAIAIMFLIAVPGLRSWWHFRRGGLTGIFVQILLFAMGGLTLSFRDLSNDPLCISTIYRSEYRIAALIQEPLSKKKGSWKTTATITLSGQNGMPTETKGRVLLYFDKSISTEGIGYGSQIYFSQKLEPILSAGNPGAFDFKRYNFFQGIYFQVFLKANQFLILPERKTKLLPRMLFDIRDKTIAILRKFIQGNREAGLAEALLLGYKDDLDKELVQSYSNTGVVHVIAISGLHLGLIYWLLGLILKPVERMPGGKIVKTIFVITGLWIFALLAGAGPSVLRSALMLTFVVCGENFFRRVSVFNSLAASAFFLLWINPYWLWDAGFQLSYAAVLSIVVFLKPIANWLYVENKMLNAFWQLNAMTLAAQILTLPLCLFHFHQFPTYFMITNVIAVPLSSIILLGEILLCAISPLGELPLLVGKSITKMIEAMNGFIMHMDDLAMASWQGLQINVTQAALMYMIILFLFFWLMSKQITFLFTAISATIFFFVIRSYSFAEAAHQQKLIVFNIPKMSAIDLIEGRHAYSFMDTMMRKDESLLRFHVVPCRTLFRYSEKAGGWGLPTTGFFKAGEKTIVCLRPDFKPHGFLQHLKADIVIISGGPKLSVCEIGRIFRPELIVVDGSNQSWKTTNWKKEAGECSQKLHVTVDKGAFEMSLD